MKRIRIVKNRVAALCLSMFLALGLIAPAFNFEAKAEALPQVLESSATIADCVMTYYAMTGSAVANTDWINTLYNSLGSTFGTIGDFAEQGLMTYVDGVWKPVEQLTENIASTSAYTSLGLDTVFNVSAEEVAAGGGYAVATGASTLSGAAACVASYGILPVLGGVTAAYWGGIGLGTLIAHKLGLYGKAVDNGIDITNESLLNKIPNGKSGVILIQSGTKSLYYASGKVYGARWKSSNGNYYNFHYIVYGNGNNLFEVTSYNSLNNNTSTVNARSEDNVYASSGLASGSEAKVSITNCLSFNSGAEYNRYVNSLRSGSNTPPIAKSPDLIGENGNLTGNYENGGYTIPDMKPQIDPQTQSGKPLSLDDWLAFANGVQTNNNGTSPIPDNTGLFQDILNAVKSLIPEGVVPDPGPGEDPGNVPVPTPNPDPDYDVDQPDTNSPESETPETDPNLNPPDFVLPNLMEKFPFCIPNDIATIFGKFRNQTRQAPYISWRFNPPGTPIDYTFNLNLSDFEEVAALLRTLELIAFVVGLAYATRYLIGSS